MRVAWADNQERSCWAVKQREGFLAVTKAVGSGQYGDVAVCD